MVEFAAHLLLCCGGFWSFVEFLQNVPITQQLYDFSSLAGQLKHLCLRGQDVI